MAAQHKIIHNVVQLIDYALDHPDIVVYIDNDQIGITDPNNEDVHMDIHPNMFMGQLLDFLKIKWDYV